VGLDHGRGGYQRCLGGGLINYEERNTERKNRTENSILEYKKKSTKRVIMKKCYAKGNS
jgi:hypothetical protein